MSCYYCVLCNRRYHWVQVLKEKQTNKQKTTHTYRQKKNNISARKDYTLCCEWKDKSTLNFGFCRLLNISPLIMHFGTREITTGEVYGPTEPTVKWP